MIVILVFLLGVVFGLIIGRLCFGERPSGELHIMNDGEESYMFLQIRDFEDVSSKHKVVFNVKKKKTGTPK